jgi:hypothetical protein
MYIRDAVPRWKRLCIIATTELDPTELAQRIEEARHAIFDQIAGGLGRYTGEQIELCNALEALNLLEKSIER